MDEEISRHRVTRALFCRVLAVPPVRLTCCAAADVCRGKNRAARMDVISLITSVPLRVTPYVDDLLTRSRVRESPEALDSVIFADFPLERTDGVRV